MRVFSVFVVFYACLREHMSVCKHFNAQFKWYVVCETDSKPIREEGAFCPLHSLKTVTENVPSSSKTNIDKMLT